MPASLPEGLLILCVLGSILLFILYPVAAVLLRSFQADGQLSLQYYADILSKNGLTLIWNSFFVAALSSLIATGLSFCIASYLFLCPARLSRKIRKLLLVTLVSPPFVSALALITLFGRRGLITYGLLGLIVNPYGWQGIVLLQVIGNTSLASLLLCSAFDRVDPAQLRASLDLGASSLTTFRRIVLPTVRPGMLSALFLLFTVNLADFSTPIIIGGKFKVLATEAYSLIISSGNLGKGAAISVLLLIPALPAFFFYTRFMRRSRDTGGSGKLAMQAEGLLRLPRWCTLPMLAVMVAFFLVMALKYGNILLSAVANTSTGHIQFTTQYIAMLRDDMVESFLRSIGYSLVAGVISSVVGILLSYYRVRRKFPLYAFEFIASLPYIIPGTFFGLGYIVAFNGEWLHLTGTAAIVILNLAFRQISVSNKTANALFPTLDLRMEDAARDLGASRIGALFTVVIPQLLPAALTSFVQTFTASMTAVGAVIFLISPGHNVASVDMFKAISSGGYGLGAVLAVMVVIVIVLVNLAASFLLEHLAGGRRAAPQS